ncbi:Asp-tRNA(Asn)/Glu-tRNA(Gln) amidotransferase subunit GatC [Helicobacter bizzozeronii]|uniref:Asp-tRNA(Asn)/Glu-tRNA(Gln) amidotransferase subunit GatC n=1 Tax=Helicobacter bizzozeronii TaxID=56877 RepID=UPI000CEDDB2A|nr:Asp-tRNA(Asn)/Glu-tRNA(Gln) amidotransferase subunit GatC [Helicobacter bizzozeronii]
MQIDDVLLDKLAQLSMLELPQDKQALKQNLEEVLGFMDNLSTLDLEGIKSLETESTPLREDVPFCDPSIPQSILEHAPKAQEGYFIVPKIIET